MIINFNTDQFNVNNFIIDNIYNELAIIIAEKY
jgi:hypothetical protein